MTPEQRIDMALQRYGEFFEPRILDASRYSAPDSKRTIALLETHLFMDLAWPMGVGEKHDMKTNRAEQHVGEWNELPWLSIRIDRTSKEAQVISHEGRHRCVYLQSRGIKLLPVMLWVKREKLDKDDERRIESGHDKIGDLMHWGDTTYRPSLLRSQNGERVYPMPTSIGYPLMGTH